MPTTAIIEEQVFGMEILNKKIENSNLKGNSDI